MVGNNHVLINNLNTNSVDHRGVAALQRKVHLSFVRTFILVEFFGDYVELLAFGEFSNAC